MRAVSRAPLNKALERMKCSLRLTLGLLLGLPGLAIAGAFSGEWSIRFCEGQKADYCGSFVLNLTQVGDRICGDHFAATPELGRLNEGSAQSVRGRVIGNIAVVVIRSGRDNSEFLARASRTERNLDWRVLEELKRGDGPDSPLIQMKARLKRTRATEDAKVAAECKSFYANAL